MTGTPTDQDGTFTILYGMHGRTLRGSHVKNSCGVGEAMSISLSELLEKHCGGIRGDWANLQAVIPDGASVTMLPASMYGGAIMGPIV